jgi:hypothetical protein
MKKFKYQFYHPLALPLYFSFLLSLSSCQEQQPSFVEKGYAHGYPRPEGFEDDTLSGSGDAIGSTTEDESAGSASDSIFGKVDGWQPGQHESGTAGAGGENPEGSGSSGTKPIVISSTNTPDGDDPSTNTPDGDGLTLITARVDLETSLTENAIYAVNSSGTVTKITIDKALGYPKKSWSGAGSGGHRTYISEIGLLMGVNGGKIYRAADDVPTTGTAQLIYADAAAWKESRTCVASFKIGERTYIGAAYTSADTRRKFVKIPVDRSKAAKVDLSAAKVYDFGSGIWGYSCYMDQPRGYFWSKDFAERGDIAGVEVATNRALTLDEAPNGNLNFAASPLRFDLNATTQSYAMAGDASGNLLSASGMYTMSHDPVSQAVFMTSSDGRRLLVAAASCFSGQTNCSSADFFAKDISVMGDLKPLSSLNDGRIVGIHRDSKTSHVYLLRLQDPKNLAGSLLVEKIAELSGDLYMYTDFTGATLYAGTFEKTFHLDADPYFDSSKGFREAAMMWRSAAGDNGSWQGIKASIRCYQEGEQKPAYEPVTLGSAGIFHTVAAGQCQGLYNRVDLKVEPQGASVAFSKTKEFYFQGLQ